MNEPTTDITRREITSHKVHPVNDRLSVYAVDAPSFGGANHVYEIGGFDVKDAPSGSGYFQISFQKGPIAEHGVNGVQIETILAILIDRLEAFQRGPFANEFNQTALDSLRTAQCALHARTLERMNRNVEGTYTP